MKKRIIAFSALVLMFLAMVFPVAVFAESKKVHSIQIDVQLNQDGSARITEVWDITSVEGTEWYLKKYGLDDQFISDLVVTDETGRQFETIDPWDVDRSLEEKDGKSGLLVTDDGYEICWGLGSYGRHVYTVSYTMTGIVKGYSDADGIGHFFIVSPPTSVDDVGITLHYPGTELTADNSGIWVFRFSANAAFESGKAVVESDRPMEHEQDAGIMMQFEKGMFSPGVVRDSSFEDVKTEAFEGSDYGQPGNSDNVDGQGYKDPSGIFGLMQSFIGFFRFLIPAAMVILFTGIFSAKSKGKRSGAVMKPEYKQAEYCRELPFNNSVKMSYVCLDDLKQLPNDGTIIGVYMLKWIYSKQVELVKHVKNGIFSSKEEDAVKLNQPAETMEPIERSLYNMLMSAAGSDSVLESKEFEKWSQRNYETVQGWIERYKNLGYHDMRQAGAATEEMQKVFFGLTTVKKTVMTPLGESLTTKMFGFKKYLEDFTIINEREAREVQLWNDYLVYAQLFGIAEKVAEQFKKLYPDYFMQMSTQYGGGLDMYDILIITHITNNYSYAMSRGYHSGLSAAEAARFSGGGGGSSMGGGGGFSGGGFSGGGFSGSGSR